MGCCASDEAVPVVLGQSITKNDRGGFGDEELIGSDIGSLSADDSTLESLGKTIESTAQTARKEDSDGSFDGLSSSNSE